MIVTIESRMKNPDISVGNSSSSSSCNPSSTFSVVVLVVLVLTHRLSKIVAPPLRSSWLVCGRTLASIVAIFNGKL